MLKAQLVLENGSVYHGCSFGFPACTSGEVVFNTGMTGYARTLTDPSYKGQILTFTYPMIGNYGVPSEDEHELGLLKNLESGKIQVQAVLLADYSVNPNHWHAQTTLQEWLEKEKIPGITGLDTRALTQELREHGTMLGKIIIEKQSLQEFFDPNKVNLVKEVSCTQVKKYGEKNTGLTIGVLDCGVKNNILRCLIKRNCTIIRFPWNYDFLENNISIDGLLVSNGPGDPKMAKESIEIIRKAMEKNLPMFGICLGSQLMALAAGANTYKLKYGHRAQNQPVQVVNEMKGFITSQNHGFAVDVKTLPKGWINWMTNLNDESNEGIKHESKPFMAVQFHPEASPGPTDTEFLFDEFLELVKKQKKD